MYTAGSIGIPAVIMREIPLEERFSLVRDALAKHIHGEVTDERDIKQGFTVGKEYFMEGSARVVRIRMYLVGGWVLFAIVEGAGKEVVKSKAAEEFYASFRLADPKK